jgi:hypothetical protein
MRHQGRLHTENAVGFSPPTQNALITSLPNTPFTASALVQTSAVGKPPQLVLYQIDDGPVIAVGDVKGVPIAGDGATFTCTFPLTAADLPVDGQTYTLTVYAWDDQRNGSMTQTNVTRKDATSVVHPYRYRPDLPDRHRIGEQVPVVIQTESASGAPADAATEDLTLLWCWSFSRDSRNRIRRQVHLGTPQDVTIPTGHDSVESLQFVPVPAGDIPDAVVVTPEGRGYHGVVIVAYYYDPSISDHTNIDGGPGPAFPTADPLDPTHYLIQANPNFKVTVGSTHFLGQSQGPCSCS